MTDVTAACWGATPFDGGFGLRRDRLRFARLLGSAFVGVGTVAGACLPLVAVATAAWIMTAPHGAIPRPDLRMPPGPLLVAATEPQPGIGRAYAGVRHHDHREIDAGADRTAGSAAGRATELRVALGRRVRPVTVRHTVASVGYDTPVEQTAPIQKSPSVELAAVPLPRPHPVEESPAVAKRDIARSPAPSPATQVASAVATPPAARACPHTPQRSAASSRKVAA